MSYEDAIVKIQRMAREKSGESLKESVATAVKLKAEMIEEFCIETKLMPDKRVRFTFPKEIKAKLKAGQKVRLEVKIFKKDKKQDGAQS